MDWKSCLADANSVKITPNKKRSAFLLKQAENTIAVMERIEIDEKNAQVFFANYYDALLEMLHALMYAEGYKVRNHLCLGYYLRDVMKDAESFRTFDRARLLRNSAIYYGERFEKPVLMESITQIKDAFKRLKKSLNAKI